MIMDTMYGTGAGGLCGNDDAGQIGVWYVFSALGLYPVCPGSPVYAVGSPGGAIRFTMGTGMGISNENPQGD